METYKTDCPCKVISNAIYKLYKSDTNDYETVSLITRPIAKIPHDYSKISSVSYSEGFGCDGVLVYGCSACSQAEDVLHDIRPMLVFTGYSVPEAGAPSIVAGIRFDVEMLKLYEQALGSKLEFGLVVAGESVLNGSSPLDGDGNVTSDKVKKLNMTARGYYDSFVKVNNLSGALLDAGIVISGYIKSGDKLYYIQGKENTEKPVSVTYNSLIQ